MSYIQLHSFLVPLAAWLLSSPACAQQILQVNGGGGTPYQTINQALAAAQNGDIIRIAAGNYSGFLATKAVRIEGGPNVVIEESFGIPAAFVSGLPAGTQFVLQSVQLKQIPSFGIEAQVALTNVAGGVLLDNVRPDTSSLPPRVDAQSCTGGLLISDCSIGPIDATNTPLQVSNTAIDSSSLDVGPVVDLNNSPMYMVDGSLRIRLPLGGAGFRLNNSNLTLGFVNGLTITTVPVGFVPSYEFDIGTNSSVLQHVFVTPNNPVVLGGPFTRNSTPVSVRVATAPVGGSVAATVVGTVSGSLVFLGFGIPGAPYSVPGVEGSVFLSSTGFVVNAGVFATGNPGTASFTVPANPALSGFPMVAQGLALLPSGLRMTNAHGFTIR